MSDHSNIEWCDASWNPIVGCSIVSPGCTNCYAMSMAARIDKMTLSSHYEGLTEKVKDKTVWTGKVALANDHIFTAPLRWRKPKRIFVNSMGDLFHEAIPDEAIDRVFAIMALCPQHTFQVLTKRAERMRAYMATENRCHIIGDQMLALADLRPGFKCVPWPFPNVWLGVSAERQQEADERIPLLLDTPAAVRFVSAEPLLGPIALRYCSRGDRCVDALGGTVRFGIRTRPNGPLDSSRVEPCAKLDWVIVGGESGPNARPMHPQWARDIRDQCAAAGVAFFFKQHGEWIGVPDLRRLPDGAGPGFGAYDHCKHDQVHEAVRVGKKRAGRLLDGVEHNAFPEPRA